MRDIKFRRVHFDYRGNYLQTTEWGILPNMFASPSSISGEDRAKSIDLQFTGLKDKNGVEIYEGDVCSKMISPDENNLAPKELHRGIIVCHYGGFCYKSRGYYYPMSRTSGVIEVIGNIYSNPHLLTSSKEAEGL